MYNQANVLSTVVSELRTRDLSCRALSVSTKPQPAQLSTFRLSPAGIARRQTSAGTSDAVQTRHYFFRLGPVSEVIPLFVICSTKPTGRIYIPKPSHRVISLLDPSMVLLQTVVQVAICSVDNLTAQYPAYRTRVRVVAVGGHLGRSMANYIPGLREEPLGRGHIALLR